MKKRFVTLALVLALLAVLVTPMAALADNTSGQGASTTSVTTILIVDKTADSAITLITFPIGAPSAVVSDPYNNVNGVGAPQVLSATVSEPVVRLKNTSGGTFFVTLEITGWTEAVVSEDYELVDEAPTDVAAVTTVLSGDGAAASVSTGISMADGTYKALYLEVTLSALTGKSGASTLSILGES